MKNLVLKYGLISGGILVGLFMATHFGGGTEKWSYRFAELIGYLTITVALLTIFVGIKDYRDNKNAGKITFLNALKTGLLINAIASLIFGIYTMLLYKVLDPDLGEKLKVKYVEEIRNSGVSAEEIEASINQMNNLPAYYENVIFQGFLMFLAVFMVGTVITLISSAILKKS